MEEIINLYDNYYKSIKLKLSKNLQKIDFHDSKLLSIGRDNDDFIMTIDYRQSISKLTFKNARIIEIDKDIEGFWWLYNEIYMTDNCYEIHILLQKCSDEYFEMKQIIIYADEVIFQ